MVLIAITITITIQSYDNAGVLDSIRPISRHLYGIMLFSTEKKKEKKHTGDALENEMKMIRGNDNKQS